MALPSPLHFYALRFRRASWPELAYRARQAFRLPPSAHGAGARPAELPAGESLDGITLPDLIPAGPDGGAALAQRLGETPGARPGTAQTDIRLLWEPARLQHATWLIFSGNRSPEAAGRIIFSWLGAHPFGRGIHFTSAMECALRIPVFCYALKRLGGLSPAERGELLEAIYRHARYVGEHLSLYSSLGNHTIAEAVGLVFAGTFFRSTSRGRRWLRTGMRLLQEELPHQVLGDGGPAEQSLNYHRFVLDLYWLALDFMEKNRLGAFPGWRPRLVLGESFLDSFRDPTGALPAIGDSDDGHAVAPGLVPRRGAPRPCAGGVVTYPDAGYTVIRDKDWVFTFDHGPLGMPPLYNHGHADALSITLTRGGRPLLVDPGTYRYNGVPEWRRYFKGTRAHNTVTVDGEDQAVQETGFIWSRPFHTTLESAVHHRDSWSGAAVHDGYARLKAPVWHRRSVLFSGKTRLLIRDHFQGRGKHRFELNYHLHPDARALQEKGGWIIRHGAARVFLRLLEGDFRWAKGEEAPILGWYAPRYGEKVPSGVLTAAREGLAAAVRFTTVIFWEPPPAADPFGERTRELDGKAENS